MHATSAPIAYFAFNRPAHTARTLHALAANPEANSTILHAFVDGPRHPGETALVQQVRDIVATATGFAAVHVHAVPANMGLFASITCGVRSVLDTHNSVIVIEDDIEVAPCFLAYMNDALTRYRDTPAVGSIHAYAPPVDGLPDYFFLEGGDCWGWATWSDRWRLFDADAGRLLHRLFEAGRLKHFCHVQGYRSLLMLTQRALGSNNSWALPWHASLFLEGRLTLHPGQSFLRNIGNDGSGEHAAPSAVYDTQPKTAYDGLPRLDLEPNPDAAGAVSTYYDSVGHTGIFAFAKRLALKLYALLLASYAAARWRHSLGGKIR